MNMATKYIVHMHITDEQKGSWFLSFDLLLVPTQGLKVKLYKMGHCDLNHHPSDLV